MSDQEKSLKFRIKKSFSNIPGLKRILFLFSAIVIGISIINIPFMGYQISYTIPSLIAAVIWAISFLVLNESSKKMDMNEIPKGPHRFFYYTFISIKSALFVGFIPFLILIILNFTVFSSQISALFSLIPPDSLMIFLLFSVLTGIFTYIFGTGFYYHAHLIGKEADIEFHAGAFKFAIALISVIIFYIIGLFPYDFFALDYIIQDAIAIISTIVLVVIFLIGLYTLVKKYHSIISVIVIAATSWFIGEIFVICILNTLKLYTTDLLLILNFLFIYVFIGIVCAFSIHLIILLIQKVGKYETFYSFKEKLIKASGQSVYDAFIVHGIMSLLLGYFFHFFGYSLLNLLPANLIIAFWAPWSELVLQIDEQDEHSPP